MKTVEEAPDYFRQLGYRRTRDKYRTSKPVTSGGNVKIEFNMLPLHPLTSVRLRVNLNKKDQKKRPHIDCGSLIKIYAIAHTLIYGSTVIEKS